MIGALKPLRHRRFAGIAMLSVLCLALLSLAIGVLTGLYAFSQTIGLPTDADAIDLIVLGLSRSWGGFALVDWLTLAAFLGLGGLVVANWRFYSAPASTSGAATGGLAGVVAVATCIPCLAAVLGLLAVAGSFLVAVTVVKIAAFGLLVWSLYKFSRCDNCRVKK